MVFRRKQKGGSLKSKLSALMELHKFPSYHALLNASKQVVSRYQIGKMQKGVGAVGWHHQNGNHFI